MSRNVAIQMDPVEGINPRGDSTLLLGHEAITRGYEVFCYEPKSLSIQGDEITAQARPVIFRTDPNDYFTAGDWRKIDLRTMDVVLMRQDPPFDMNYLTATYILERLQPDVLVVNDPKSVRDCPEKIFPLLFGDFMPPTLISADNEAIREFREQHKDIIIKPLYGHGGNAVFRLREDDGNFSALLEFFFARSPEPLIFQKYLAEVVSEDRRIILIDGKVAGVLGRIPAAGEHRANFRVGGTAAHVELTPRQQQICDIIGPELKKRGLLLVGLDVIGDWLTEINVTSPTGLQGINRMYGRVIEREVWDAIEGKF